MSFPQPAAHILPEHIILYPVQALNVSILQHGRSTMTNSLSRGTED